MVEETEKVIKGHISAELGNYIIILYNYIYYIY